MRFLPLIMVLALLCGCSGNPSNQGPLGCPEDIEICPDGSTVARVPPDCAFAPCPAPLASLSVSTDTGLYRSRQTMNITLVAESDSGSPTEVWVHGIEARGRERLNIRKNGTLRKGETVIEFSYTTPSCTGCAGISPGEYLIMAELTLRGETLRDNVTVRIEQ